VSVESSLPCAMADSAGRAQVRRRAGHWRSAGFGIVARRFFNAIAAASGLVVLAIPFVLIMVAIKATSPGPVFFRQVRVGRGGRLFHIYKFRTMFERRSGVSRIGVGEPTSVTPVGRFLRRTKIDELPQLINVLVGNMNLVGPRPELPEFVAKYSGEDRGIILSVAPGMTDFASIRFRNEELLLAAQQDPLAYYERVLMPAKLRYYRFYVRRASLGLDLYVIAQTVLALGRDFLHRTRSP
jgi:lipopolysaccharide/colanic/teichoic acid biosynthesis glycosyltransferase